MFTENEKLTGSILCLAFAAYMFYRLYRGKKQGVFEVTDHEFDTERKYVRQSSQPREYRTQERIHIVLILVLLAAAVLIYAIG